MPAEVEDVAGIQNAAAFAEMQRQVDRLVQLTARTTAEQIARAVRGESTAQEAALQSGVEASVQKKQRLQLAGRCAAEANNGLHAALRDLVDQVQRRVPLRRRFGALPDPPEGRVSSSSALRLACMDLEVLRDIFNEHADSAGVGSLSSAKVGLEWLARIGELAVRRHVEWAEIYEGFAATSELSEAWVEADRRLCEGQASAKAREARVAAAKAAVLQAAGSIAAKDAAARKQLVAALQSPSEVQLREQRDDLIQRLLAAQEELARLRQAAASASVVPTEKQLRLYVDALVTLGQDYAMGETFDMDAAKQTAVQEFLALCSAQPSKCAQPMDHDGALGDAAAADTKGAGSSAASTRALSGGAGNASPRAR
ncbi:MAG: hypothetical protein WCC69_04010 [Pirellulales bacterium]